MSLEATIEIVMKKGHRMRIGKQQVFYFCLVLLSGFVAWYSLGVLDSCAHFNVREFCNDLSSVSSTAEINRLMGKCTRLANLSVELCHYTFTLGLSSLILGAVTLVFSVRAFIYANIEDNWNDEIS